MEIIKHGTKKNMKISCRNCGCIYLFSFDDTDTYPFPSIGDIVDMKRLVNCPECGMAEIVKFKVNDYS